MGKPAAWSLGGDPPEPQYMPTPTPEEAAAVREELSKLDAEKAKEREDAVKRGIARAKKEAAAKAATAAKETSGKS